MTRYHIHIFRLLEVNVYSLLSSCLCQSSMKISFGRPIHLIFQSLLQAFFHILGISSQYFHHFHHPPAGCPRSHSFRGETRERPQASSNNPSHLDIGFFLSSVSDSPFEGSQHRKHAEPRPECQQGEYGKKLLL